MTDEEWVEPNGFAEFQKRDRCPAFLKQEVAPGEEETARPWKEAFGVLNLALLGNGQEFEATQVEAIADGAAKVIGPEEVEAASGAGVPDIRVDESWRDSSRGCAEQLREAVREAARLKAADGGVPYIVAYQAPVAGEIGAHEVGGDADLIVFAPATEDPDRTGETTDAVVKGSEGSGGEPEAERDRTVGRSGGECSEAAMARVRARVIDCKAAEEEQAFHRVQVAIYCRLLEQTLAEGLGGVECRIEGSVVTQAEGVADGESLAPFSLAAFRRAEWELVVEQLLASGGQAAEILDAEVEELPFSIDQVCDNCSYREACMTRATEDPTHPASLALLGLDAATQRALREREDCGVENLRDLAELLERDGSARPTDDPPAIDLPADQRRALEEVLPDAIHETVQRAQALLGEIDPDYPAFRRPPAIKGKGWVPLPDDRCEGWGGLDGASPGELIHVALFVRPDAAINRVAALGACVYADAHGEYVTIGEVIDAVPDAAAVADSVERELFDRFLTELVDAIAEVARAIGHPEEAILHCYTYTRYEQDALAEGLDRHEDMAAARALRALMSLRADGQTEADQAMLSAVQPIVNDYFALQYPSQGLLAVVDQFCPEWTRRELDPMETRPDAPPLRAIFGDKFLDEWVPYLEDDPGIRLHLAPGPLAEGPAAEAVPTDADQPSPDGWFPVRKRTGAQFPIEYIWAAVPQHPDDAAARLTPAVLDEWDVDDEDRDLYRQEIDQFRYRTANNDERITTEDIEYLVERLSYAFMRLIEAIPYKDAFRSKEPVDATSLEAFRVGPMPLPVAARDYLRLEGGAQRDTILEHYRASLRERSRTGRSLPVQCVDYDHNDDGSLTIHGEFAHDVLFDDPATAARVAHQVRIRDADGAGSGSWRVLTRLTPDTPTEHNSRGAASDDDDSDDRTGGDGDSPSARGGAALREHGIDDPTAIKHSPPVFIDAIDPAAGTITFTLFPHRFTRNGSPFRVDHCGWQSPTESNLDHPEQPASERDGYINGRDPVWIDTDERYILDPMIDDLGAPKADRALTPVTVQHNALWQHLTHVHQTGIVPYNLVAAPARVTAFLETLTDHPSCLEPNADQKAFITSLFQALVGLQGPPGTGKTSGATAPALLARAAAHAQANDPFIGVVVAPSHAAVETLLGDVVDRLQEYRTATNGLPNLELVRVRPTSADNLPERADTNAPDVDATYCNYLSDAGAATLARLATQYFSPQQQLGTDPGQCLLFATPTTLYRVLEALAEELAVIDGETAPAAMRYQDGLADLLCVDEASMLDLPRFFLAGSILKPTGQTLIIGDHRQLNTVTQHDWDSELRRPIQQTNAHLSALNYIRWLNTTTDPASPPTATPTTDTPPPQQTGAGTHTDDTTGDDAGQPSDPAGGETDD